MSQSIPNHKYAAGHLCQPPTSSQRGPSSQSKQMFVPRLLCLQAPLLPLPFLQLHRSIPTILPLHLFQCSQPLLMIQKANKPKALRQCRLLIAYDSSIAEGGVVGECFGEELVVDFYAEVAYEEAEVVGWEVGEGLVDPDAAGCGTDEGGVELLLVVFGVRWVGGGCGWGLGGGGGGCGRGYEGRCWVGRCRQGGKWRMCCCGGSWRSRIGGSYWRGASSWRGGGNGCITSIWWC